MKAEGCLPVSIWAHSSPVLTASPTVEINLASIKGWAAAERREGRLSWESAARFLLSALRRGSSRKMDPECQGLEAFAYRNSSMKEEPVLQGHSVVLEMFCSEL